MYKKQINTLENKPLILLVYNNIFKKYKKLIIIISEKKNNARYTIKNQYNLILHSRSVGSLGLVKKEKRLKKWRKKLGEHLTYWSHKKLKKQKYKYIYIYMKGRRKVVGFLFYQLKYYLRKKKKKIRKINRYKKKEFKHIMNNYKYVLFGKHKFLTKQIKKVIKKKKKIKTI